MEFAYFPRHVQIVINQLFKLSHKLGIIIKYLLITYDLVIGLV